MTVANHPIALSELIERWSNTDRVLDAMTEHERQHHWDMSAWGRKTDCGTIVCAAGGCGLDSWFRERGFKLTFKRNGETTISDVPAFFGLEGASRIFYDGTQRPVETVLSEVRAYVGELQNLAELESRPGLPKIGEAWPEHGGIYVGARLGVGGAPNYHLIAGPEYDGELDWDAATSWARQVSVAGESNFWLPRRSEAYLLFDRVRSLFKPRGYWLEEQHAEYPTHAWRQYFNLGYQYYWFKDSKLRARAVRRLAI